MVHELCVFISRYSFFRFANKPRNICIYININERSMLPWKFLIYRGRRHHFLRSPLLIGLYDSGFYIWRQIAWLAFCLLPRHILFCCCCFFFHFYFDFTYIALRLFVQWLLGIGLAMHHMKQWYLSNIFDMIILWKWFSLLGYIYDFISREKESKRLWALRTFFHQSNKRKEKRVCFWNALQAIWHCLIVRPRLAISRYSSC